MGRQTTLKAPLLSKKDTQRVNKVMLIVRQAMSSKEASRVYSIGLSSLYKQLYPGIVPASMQTQSQLAGSRFKTSKQGSR